MSDRDRDRRRSRRSSSREPPSNYSTEGRRPPDVAGMTSLKVDNLSYRTAPEDLKPLFEKYGEVGDVYIPRDRFTKESRGFSFVRFYDKRDAEEAMDRLDGYVLDGREIRVQLARYGRPSEPPHVRYGKNYIPPRGKHERSRYSRSRSRSNSRSKSRSPRRRYSKSRSRSPRRYNRRQSRSPYRGRSGSRERADRRLPRSTSKERSNNDSKQAQKANSRSRSRSRSAEAVGTRGNDYIRKSTSASPRKERSRSPKSRSPPAEEELKSSHSNENVVIDECSPGMATY